MITAKRYRKRPVVIEAIKWDGTNYDAVIAFLGKDHVERTMGPGIDALYINTLEGVMRADLGDWIIRGVTECYPCKPDIFEITYEAVESTS
jgi:hypothetical protein